MAVFTRLKVAVAPFKKHLYTTDINKILLYKVKVKFFIFLIRDIHAQVHTILYISNYS